RTARTRSTCLCRIDGPLLRFYCCVVSILAFLHVTPREESVVVLVPALGKKKFVSLGRSVVKLRHAAALFARRLCVFHSEHKTKDCLSILGNFSLLSGFRIGCRLDTSNEMPAVFVGLVHLHGSVFIKERLLFFGEIIRLAGAERYEGGRHNQQQSERSFVHGERSGRYRISFKLFDVVPDASGQLQIQRYSADFRPTARPIPARFLAYAPRSYPSSRP